MDLVNYWKKVVLENYANFSGRARRAEYWWFVLANIVVYIVLSVIIGGVSDALGGLLSLLYYLAVLIPSIAVGIRRLHDLGKSGWYLLIALIPVVGAIVLLVWAATDSQRGSNQYGVSEKYPNG